MPSDRTICAPISGRRATRWRSGERAEHGAEADTRLGHTQMEVSLQGLGLKKLRVPTDIAEQIMGARAAAAAAEAAAIGRTRLVEESGVAGSSEGGGDVFSPLATRSARKSRKRKREGDERVVVAGGGIEVGVLSKAEAEAKVAAVTGLDVSCNQLSNLPATLATKVRGLAVLDASNNRIGIRNSVLPAQLATLEHLARIDLSWNKLKTVAPCIGALPALTYLNLADNELTEVPDSLAGVAATLRTLNIDGNEELRAVPPVVPHLTALTELYMDATSLTKLPAELAALTRLNSLTAAGNNLGHGSCPGTLTGLVSLANLVLDDNNLKAVPSFVTALPLKWLSLRDNPIRSIAPAAKIATLVELDVQDTNIERLPPQLAALPRLQYIGADNTDLEDIPPKLEIAVASGRLAIGLPYHLRIIDPPQPRSPIATSFALRSRRTPARTAPRPRPPTPPATPPNRTISFAEPATIAAVRYFDITETPSMVKGDARASLFKSLSLSSDSDTGSDDDRPTSPHPADVSADSRDSDNLLHMADVSLSSTGSLDSPTRFS